MLRNSAETIPEVDSLATLCGFVYQSQPLFLLSLLGTVTAAMGECSKTFTVVSRLPRQPIRSCLRGAPSAPLTVSFSSGTFNCTHTPPSETVTAVLPKGLQRSGSLLHTGGPVNAKRTRNIDSYSHVRHCPSSFFYGSDHLLGKGRLAAKAV